MSTHVPLQSTRSTKNASRTHHIRTVSRSCEYACGLSIYQIGKAFIANITFVRFLVRVNTLVGFQMTTFTKNRKHHTRTVFAHITFIRLLVCVNTHAKWKTFAQSPARLKLSHTRHTIRFLVRVNTHVYGQT